MADIVTDLPTTSPRAGEQHVIQEYLKFSLASEFYGFKLTNIREILSLPPITPVPRAPEEVVGVCSVRGLLVTVVDLGRLLKLTPRPLGRRARILLAEARSGEVLGLLVDEVSHVLRLSTAEVESASSAFGGEVPEHVAGVARPEGQVMILLELGSLFSTE
ncbi:MAG TPA: chemotaxis protein CheW [Polyangiaceae bacterium]|jgi:purine-binding chemotaxis protein CheW